MAENKKITTWTIISFIIGTLLGSGAIWKYLDYEISKERLLRENALATTELREKIEPLYFQIIDLTEEYLEVSRRGPSPDRNNKKRKLKGRLDLVKDNFANLEQKLAQLENREPRVISLDFIPPAPPTGLRIQ